MELLVKQTEKDGKISYYDMYAQFGLALGEHLQIEDEVLNRLSVAILSLPGDVLRGVKWLETASGMEQHPQVRWIPDYLFTNPEYQKCHLLYYTGITCTAKGILTEVVRNMFLNVTQHLDLLARMKRHTLDVYEAIQRGDLEETGRLVRKMWEQDKRLDVGTDPPQVEAIIRLIDDYCLGYKLPGAGGGGFLYMIAKDAEASARIR